MKAGAGGRLFASLRARLLIVTILVLLLGLLVSDAVMLSSLRGHLLARVDSQLRTFSLAVSRIPVVVAPDTRFVGGDPDIGRMLLANLDLIGAFSVSYLGPDGERLSALSIPAEAEAGAPRLPRLDPASVRARAGRPFSVDARDGGSGWRVVVVPYQGAATDRVPGGSSVAIAASEADVDATISRLTTACLLAGVLLTVALGVAGRFAIRAQLRPLRRIEATAAAIAAGDLSRRVEPVTAPGTEVGRLTDALNGMLGQLEAAFEARARANRRMRDFLADVSHELRTPLFAIHGSTQLYQMGGLADPAELDRTMHRIESESARLARLATDLLLLARLESDADAGAGAGRGADLAGSAALDPAPMDLRTLAADARVDIRALDPDREIRLTGPDGGEPGSAPVLGDEARLRQVTANLVGNAVIHTPAGTPLRIGVGTVDGSAVWELEDAGPGMTPEDVERIFDPFYRVDSSRSRAAGAGAGLGLAIVRALVLAHGGQVTARTAPGQGTTMRVTLPLPPDA